MNWSFHAYELPLARPYVWAKGTQTVRRGLLVACSADGVTGWGEVAPAPHLDVDPRRIATFARKAMRVPMAQGDVPAALDAANCGPRLRSGLAGAWLDLQARLAGKPLGAFVAARMDLEGAQASRVPVNSLVTAQSPAACATDAQTAVAQGYTTLKLKSDGNPGVDLARVSAVRKAVGPDVAIRLDANESYAPATALASLRALEPFGIEYVEQPIAAAQRDALVALMQDSPVPIALDESATSWLAVAPFKWLRPIVILKPQRLGGIDRTLAFIGKANQAGMRCVVTNSLETAVGRAHALHAASCLPAPIPACGLATGGLLAEDVVPTPALPSLGWMDIPANHGIGFEPKVGEVGLAAALE